MMRQYREVKSRHQDAFVFFRVGDFYELFFDDAVGAAAILNIALTSRDKNEDGAIPMAGVPYHAADNYIRRLIKAGHKVVVCDQMEDARLAKGLVKREISRVYTAGTIVNPDELDPRSNNYIAAIFASGSGFAVAFADVSCGEVRHFATDDYIRDVIERFTISEILIPIAQSDRFASLSDRTSATISSIDFIPTAEQESEPESAAIAMISAYLKDTVMLESVSLRNAGDFSVSDFLAIDENTKRDLEIFEPIIRGSGDFSLLGVMDSTITAMGGRKIRQMLTFPLCDRAEIEKRIQSVDMLVHEPHLIEPLRNVLKSISDIERISASISAPSPSPRHLVQLKDSLLKLPALRSILTSFGGRFAFFKMDDLPEVSGLIANAIVDAPPHLIRDGGVIASGYSAELDEIRSLLQGGTSYLVEYERRLRESTGITSLKVGYNKIFGYYIEVTKSNIHLVPADFIRRQTLTNAERYITEELKGYEDKVLSAGDRARELEIHLYRELLAGLAQFQPRLCDTAAEIADVDVLASFASNAIRFRYVKPEFNSDGVFAVTAGRHPFVERSIDSFVPNDTGMDHDDNRIMLITGPNMSGKSTYMRQTVLIAIMAQTGSFVPADRCVLPVFDHIFTRIGTSDFLASGKSTFMVEMLETARILNKSTERSLVVLDEVGRGTSTYDGMSIAWSVLEHLSRREQGPLVLFSTHYHELTTLALTHKNVKNYNVMVREWEGEVIFLHKIAVGSANKSYGIHVAKLAGLPDAVVERAGQILDNLELEDIEHKRPPEPAGKERVSQMSLFGGVEERLRVVVEGMDINNTTPMEAFEALKKMKEILAR